jgi:MiaB-like tRNA modifying enzyme
VKKVFFKTFGCRTNLFDTQVMIENLGEHALVSDESEADAVVINSCAVTNHSESVARNYINRVKRDFPDVKLLFTGCGAKGAGASLLKKALVDGVFSHSLKSGVASYVDRKMPFIEIGEEGGIDDTLLTRFDGKTKAFVKIQEGCDFDCSYCVIPSVRGRARSVDERLILDQINILTQRGFEEFVLTGTNIGSYGLERGTSLAALLEKIGKIGGVKRVRLGSVEPSQIDDRLLDALNAPFMAKHLHIALQHASDRVLASMNRRNRFESDCALLLRAARMGFAIGTDYIVGFPTESRDDHTTAIDRLKLLPLTHIHLFAYSPREGTKAASIKTRVDGKTIAERRMEIEEIIRAKHREFYDRQKETLTVLIESKNSGYDQFFSRVRFESDRTLLGWQNAERYRYENGEIVANV